LQNMQLAQFFSQLQQKRAMATWGSTARDCRNALQPGGSLLLSPSPPVESNGLHAQRGGRIRLGSRLVRQLVHRKPLDLWITLHFYVCATRFSWQL